MPDPEAHPGAEDERSFTDRFKPRAASIDLSGIDYGVDGATAVQIARGEHEMRRDLARGILKVFVVGNAALWVLVVALVVIDVVTVGDGLAKSGERIIDQRVVETLIGATTVQVGIIMAVVARSLFRR